MSSDGQVAAAPGQGDGVLNESKDAVVNSTAKAEVLEPSSNIDVNDHSSDEGEEEDGDASTVSLGNNGVSTKTEDQPPMSKNQLKKLKRKQTWEDSRESRKRKRREKRHDRQARKRTELEAKLAEAEAAGRDPQEVLKAMKTPQKTKTVVPVSFIVDCDFEDYMHAGEIVSLASQVTRCYSDNRSAAFNAHLFVSSFKGKLKTRFETVMSNCHLRWHGVHLTEDDFVEAGIQAHEIMRGPTGGTVTDVLKTANRQVDSAAEDTTGTGSVDVASDPKASIVYLTADSEDTLDRLEPYTSYVVGGLVDRNREKNLCYRRAQERGIRTAKLPIGQYMQMRDRQVLATNHVVEIMSKWLECGDWASAFLAVIPKRKGSTLKNSTTSDEGNVQGGDREDRPESVPEVGRVADVSKETGQELAADPATDPAEVEVVTAT